MQAQAMIEAALVLNGVLDPETPMPALTASRALIFLNLMIRSLVGDGLGGRLVATEVNDDADVQSGFVYQCDTIGGAFTLTLPADPREGQLFGVADARLNFATAGVQLLPGGRLLEGSRDPLELETTGDNRTWFYRADTANWERVRDLALADAIYFPAEVHEALTWMLAQRLTISFGGQFDVALATQGRNVFTRRFGRRGALMTDPPTGVTSPASTQRGGAF